MSGGWEVLGQVQKNEKAWLMQTEAAVITLNHKVVDKFLKVCAEGHVPPEERRMGVASVLLSFNFPLE